MKSEDGMRTITAYWRRSGENMLSYFCVANKIVFYE